MCNKYYVYNLIRQWEINIELNCNKWYLLYRWWIRASEIVFHRYWVSSAFHDIPEFCSLAASVCVQHNNSANRSGIRSFVDRRVGCAPFNCKNKRENGAQRKNWSSRTENDQPRSAYTAAIQIIYFFPFRSPWKTMHILLHCITLVRFRSTVVCALASVVHR